MNPVLQKIIATKKLEIKEISSFKNLPKPKYSLKEFLLSKKGSIIAECKKGSPSMGIIKEDYNALSIAREYYQNGASAISVLTDVEYFFGSKNDLKEVAANIPLPAIRKDFIIDKKQIEEAAFLGASAILLIVRILSRDELKELYNYAKSLGLDILVETHNENEVKTALEIDADIIGINTRDLDTFKIYPDLIEKVSNIIPKNKIIVGESGIKNASDCKNMIQFTQSTLIGTFFMQKTSIKEGFQELLNN
ncbi:MAG: indole-3-glycerol-phosphate synthase [Leptospiraceae bacterium]|nr:indole-3-glycerol-phosphate synthase [Leptospiraceae bacterium]